MNVLSQEWVDKAEGDFHTALRESRVRKAPNYDAVCFHSQQCAEKYLKAYLQEHNQSFPYRHDLIPLLDLTLLYDALIEMLRPWLIDLNHYAIDFRYPGERTVKEDAQDAIRAVRHVRDFMHQKLGI